MRVIVLVSILFLSACSANPLSVLLGKPGITADLQVGKENTQQIVAQQTTQEAGRDLVSKQGSVEAQQIKEVNIQQTPIWMIILLILGWLLPSPNEIARWIRGLFSK